MRFGWILAVGVLVGAALAGRASADQFTFLASRDNTLYEDPLGSVSNGDGQYMFVGRTNTGDMRRALVAFDLSLIPPGSTVTAATLTLQVSRVRTNSGIAVSAHRVLASWGENLEPPAIGGEEGAGGQAMPGDATWIHRFYNTQFWNSPGGDFVATASATTTVGGVGTYSWSGPGLVADVQAWVNNPASNHGWLLRGGEGASGTAKRFNTRQHSPPPPEQPTRPRLVVTFTPPAHLGSCCMPTGACIVTTPELCAEQGGVYGGDGTVCSPNPCYQPTGACCMSNGTCDVRTLLECEAVGGVFQGDGVPCTPGLCPVLSGACCLPSGVCVDATEADCAAQGGTFRGAGVLCEQVSCPILLEPFVDRLPIPPIAQPTSGSPGGVATYTITMEEFTQQLHRDLPPTRLWGYNGMYPGPTIVARRNNPVTVTWVNNIRDEQGVLRTSHYFPVDECLHGPSMNGSAPYTVVHLHGINAPTAADGHPDLAFLPGEQSEPYVYPNAQPGGLLWYHDHALGLTRLNVYMGLAGAYLLRDSVEVSLTLPTGEFDVPLIIQDRSFNPDGSLKYPAAWQDQFFGDFILVNGKVWPYMNVRRGKYRLRMLNGCNSRTLTLSLSNGATFYQIGGDHGLLPAPVPVQSVTIGPAERADVVVDFGSLPAGSEVLLVNSAPAPYPGAPGVGVVPNVMKFIVGAQLGFTGEISQSLTNVPPIPTATAARERTFELRLMQGEQCSQGQMWTINGLGWEDITETVRLGSVEIWSFVNLSPIMHPMHLHLVSFQVLDRQDIEVVEGEVIPVGPRVPPPPEESGWKDTVRTYPMQITRVIARFNGFTGVYPYHCHLLEHEDHEMMRQFRVTCAADWNLDLAANSADISAYLTAWLDGVNTGSLAADINNSGSVNSSDISAYLTLWINTVTNGCE